MSNEWSASVATVQDGDRAINHQYSKSDVVRGRIPRRARRSDRRIAVGPGMPDYFSALRPRTELWIAEQFAQLRQYHDTFRSCNRAFHIDKSLRLDHWCGQCDKCCFIDLILAPFLPATDLSVSSAITNHWPIRRWPIVSGRCSVRRPHKPFECVGEVNECRAASARGAAPRPDRGQTAPGTSRRGGRAARTSVHGRTAPSGWAITSFRPRRRSRMCWRDHCASQALLVGPAGSPRRRLRTGPRGPGQRSQADQPGRRAGAGRRPTVIQRHRRPARFSARVMVAWRPGKVRRGGEVPGGQPVQAGDASGWRNAACPWPEASASGCRSQHRTAWSASPAPRARARPSSIAGHLLNGLGYRCPGRREHRPAAVRPGGARTARGTTGSSRSPATRPRICPAPPPVTAVTSLHPDHLPWHDGADNYSATSCRCARSRAPT